MQIPREMEDPLDKTKLMEETKRDPWIPVIPVKIGPPNLRKRATREDDNQSMASSERHCGEKRRKDDKTPIKQQTSPRRDVTNLTKSTVRLLIHVQGVPHNQKAPSPSNCPLLDNKRKAACPLTLEAMNIIVKGASDDETRTDKDVHQVKRKHNAEAGLRKLRFILSWKWLSQPRVDTDNEIGRAWTFLNECASEHAEKEIERDIRILNNKPRHLTA